MYYRVQSQLAWQKIGEEVVVIDLRQNRLYGLSPAAGALVAMVAQTPWAKPQNPKDEPQWQRLVEAGFLEARPAVEVEARVQMLPTPAGLEESPLHQWEEPLATFAKACLFLPGQSDPCNQAPAS